MLDNIKHIVKHTALYALGNISPKLAGFILLPLYTRHITVADYGILGLLEVIDLVATHVLGVGTPQSLLRWHSLTDNEQKRKSQVFTIVVFLATICTAVILTVTASGGYLSQLLFDSADYTDHIVLVFIAVSFSLLAKVPLTLLRAEDKAHLYMFSVVSRFSASLILNIYFVATRQLGVRGVLLAQAMSSAFALICLLPYLMKRMWPRLEGKDLVSMIIFGAPFILGTIASSILTLGDRYILKWLSTFNEVGLYTLGFKFSNIMKVMLVDAFSLGLPVIGWRIVKENKNPQRFFSKVLTYVTLILLWSGLVVAAYSKGLIHRFALDQAYWDAYKVVPYLVLSVIFVGMQSLFFFELQIPKKTTAIAIIITVAATLNVGLNFLLIPHFGMLGAAYATVIAQFASLAMAYRVANKAYPVHYEYKRLVQLFTTAFLIFAVTTFFDDLSFWERICYKGLVIVSFPALLFFWGFYEKVELDRMRGSVRKWSRKIRFRA